MAGGCRSSLTPSPEPSPTPETRIGPVDAGRMIWPRRLAPGDTIAFVAPAGELDRERMALARSRLEARGYTVVHRDDLFAVEGYLAGSDERRGEELMEAFRDPRIAAIFPGTGGYGTMRILDRLDYAFIRAHPKPVIGFSDITALHAALNRHAGLVTFHSPAPMWGLGSPDGLAPLAEKWFFRAIEGGVEPWVIDAAGVASGASAPRTGNGEEAAPPPAPLTAWGRGRARGRLVGGNLSMISALEGTPYAIDTRDAILLIEDVREAPYRIDRMLRQLQLAGKLAQLRGAVIGQFTRNYDREDEQKRDDPRYTVDGVLRQYFGEAGVPVLVSFPIGHVRDNLTLPLGALVEIDADRVALTVLEDAGGDWLPGAAAPSPSPEWRRTAVDVRPGMRLVELSAGSVATAPRFVVIVGEHREQAEADATLARLEGEGFGGRIGYGTTRPGAYTIQLPDFTSRAAAEAALAALRDAGVTGRVVEAGQDATSPSGPWSARLLEVDPRAFRVEVEHSADAAIGVETTRALAGRRGAVAAINGGYYVTKGLLKGDSTGLLKIDGRLLSEPDRGRAAVGFIERDGAVRPIFGRLVLDGTVRLGDGASVTIDGLNRARGAAEAVVYTPEFHRTTLTDRPGLEAVVAGGRIVERRAARGGAAIPTDGWVLSLGAERALADGERLRVGETAELTLRLCPFRSPDDCAEVDARWGEADDALAGGPLLLRDGIPVVDAASEAFSSVFALARHPRTALGVRADGTLLLLTVDGRQPEHSVGMSLPELTALLRELGAVDAINLDGGGSTTMVVEGRTVNRPSDPGGERENGDALLVFPRD